MNRLRIRRAMRPEPSDAHPFERAAYPRSRRLLVAVLTTFAVLTATVGLRAEDASALDGIDGWSSVVELRDEEGWYVSPVHASLLPDGEVHFIGLRRLNFPMLNDGSDRVRRHAFTMWPDLPGSALPATRTIDSIAQPVEFEFLSGGGAIVSDDLVCAGHTFTADGNLFIAGGTRSLLNVFSPAGSGAYLGLPTQTLFKFDQTWERLNDMTATGLLGVPYRWYPTTTRLPDGRILISGGYDSVTPTPLFNLSTEVFDPDTGLNQVASPFGLTPAEIANADYTHAWVLPWESTPFDLLMFGQKGIPVLNSTMNLQNWWVRSANIRPGASPTDTHTNHGTSSVMLPIRSVNGDQGYNNGSVLMVGGGHATDYVDRIDVYDPIANSWIASDTMGGGRHHPSSLLLPDGRVLILMGHNLDGVSDTMLKAQYVDPANNFAITNGTASSGVIRGYHSTATLLLDGRVLVAGGRDVVTSTTIEKPTYQYYEPDYMDEDRLTIEAMDQFISYGSIESVETSGTGTPTEVMLIALPSQTHSFDFNQRAIQLPIAENVDLGNGITRSVFGTPGNAHVAPPGQYMVFVLDENRVPSIAVVTTIL